MKLINLIINEITKIVKKPSFYVLVLILLLFVFGTNYLYKYKLGEDGSIKETPISIGEEISKLEIEMNKTNDIDKKVYNKTSIDVLKLSDRYGINSWQSYYINKKVSNLIKEINYAYYENREVDKSIIDEYDRYINIFDSGNWKQLIYDEIDNFKEEISIYEEEKINGSYDENIDKMINIKNQMISVLEKRMEYDVPYNNGYLNDAMNIYQYNETNFADKETQSEYYLSEYIVKSRENINRVNDERGIIVNFYKEYGLIIVIIFTVLTSGIVVDEVNKGTIKQLLVTPNKRYKILLSKYLTGIIIILFLILITFLMQLLIGGTMLSFRSLRIPFVYYDFNLKHVVTMNIFKYFIILTLYKMPMFIILNTVLLFLNVFTNNKVITTILVIVLYASNTMSIALSNDFNALVYYIGTHFDLSIYRFGMIIENTDLNLLLSSFVVIAYFIVLIVPTFVIFNKKDIKNT